MSEPAGVAVASLLITSRKEIAHAKRRCDIQYGLPVHRRDE